jgi:GT2 family glycosyltransferase
MLSIVVVNYNTRTLLLRCLNSVEGQLDASRPVEVVVVDNNSSDGSASAVRERFPHVLLLENECNEGYARAVNRGLRQAQGDLIVILNADTELRAGALENSLSFMERFIEAGIGGCRLLNEDGSLQPSCEGFPTVWNVFCEAFFLDSLFWWSPRFGGLRMRFFKHDRVLKVDRVMGAFMIVRRRLLEEIGYLDERFFFYSEEVDWCFRAWRGGWPIYFFPDAEVVHYGGASADPLAGEYFVEKHRNRYRFYRKHHNWLSSVSMRVAAAIGILFRLIVWTAVTLGQWVWGRATGTEGAKKMRAYVAVLKWYIGLPTGRTLMSGENEP